MSNVSEQDGFVHFWKSNIKSKKKIAETEIGSLVAHSLFLRGKKGQCRWFIYKAFKTKKTSTAYSFGFIISWLVIKRMKTSSNASFNWKSKNTFND